MAKDPSSVGDILDRLDEDGKGKDKVSIGDIVESFGHRSFGPFLLVPAIVDISPVGAIPGLPTVLAAIIVLVAAQLALGRKHLWLPGFVERREIGGDKLRKAADKMRPVGRFLDRWFHGRLPALTKGPFVRIAAVACIALAFTVPPLELLPLATTLPMAAIASFGMALLVRDGALMLAATAFAVATAGFGAWTLMSGG